MLNKQFKPDNKAIGLDFLKLIFVFFLISALAEWQFFGISFFVLLGVAVLMAFIMLHRRVNSILLDTQKEELVLEYYRITGRKTLRLPFQDTKVAYEEERDGKGALRYSLKISLNAEEKVRIIPMLNGWTEKVLEEVAREYKAIVNSTDQ